MYFLEIHVLPQGLLFGPQCLQQVGGGAFFVGEAYGSNTRVLVGVDVRIRVEVLLRVGE